MSHKHWCEIGKHEWECDGTQAVRIWAGETHPTLCQPLPDGIEAVSCPAHLEEDRRLFLVALNNPELRNLFEAICASSEDTSEYEEAISKLMNFLRGEDQ